MKETPIGLRMPRSFWMIALWCAGGIVDASQSVLVMRSEGGHHTWLRMFGSEFISWLPWVIATPIVSTLARRYRQLSWGTIRVHLEVLALISVIAASWYALLTMIINPWGHPMRPGPFPDVFANSLLYQSLTYLIVYVLIIAITLAIDYRDSIARQRTETARLNEELSQAQLAALRRQMEPHFMFNTLNSIAGLVRDQRNEAAVGMIVGLSDFLRRASEDFHRPQVALGEEVEYLQRYTEIQKTRFAERLRVSIDIPAELLQARVPSLLLQPLVENGIKHGIAKRVAGGAIHVTAERCDSHLRLRVFNDGPRLPAGGQTPHTGIGLTNLRTRLQILHGSDFSLQLQDASGGGAEVVVTLPFTTT
jgi:two-component system, LytTR family, sensor kinase